MVGLGDLFAMLNRCTRLMSPDNRRRHKGGKFCNGSVQSFGGPLNTHNMSGASGLAISSNGKYFYVIDDNPGRNPFIFVHEKQSPGESRPARRAIIKIGDVPKSNFKSMYGDWEACYMGTMPNDPKKKCIIVADTGHNAARGKPGRMRSSDQPARLIYVEEPSDRELERALENGDTINRQGSVYDFQYTRQNKQYDCEAMAFINDIVFVITKNKKSGHKSFVYMCPNSALQRGRMNTFECVGQMTIEFSEVTDAFITHKMLALRTYQAILFYSLADLQEGRDTPLKGSHRLQEISRQGQQEAMAYDRDEHIIFFVGEGSKKMFSLNFDASAAASNWPFSRLLDQNSSRGMAVSTRRR